jgi:hypothetical protein
MKTAGPIGNFWSSVLLGSLVAASVVSWGCSFNRERTTDGGASNPPPQTIPGLTAIRVAPTDASVVLDPSKPAPTQQFQAFGTINGQEQDITSRVSWTSDRPIVASVDKGGLATAVNSGGIATITAKNGTQAASGRLSVTFTGTFVVDGTPALPADPGSKFTGPDDPTRAPQLVYPNDHVLLPPNVFGIETHFRPGSASNTLFQVHFQSTVGDFTIYTRCTPLADGCLYLPTRPIWTSIAETNRGTGMVQLTVRGTDDAGTSVGTSATFNLQFSKDDIRGGLYYWTTSGQTGIMRWNFNDTTATVATRFISTQFTGGTCVGCHSLSRDGTKIVASAGGQNDGRLLLFDVAGAKPLAAFPLAQKSQFETWNSKGTQFVGMYTDNVKTGPSDLNVFDGMTGAVTGTISVGGRRADHPDWSPDDNRIVFTSVDTTGSYTDQRPGKAGISYVDNEAGTWTVHDLLPPVPGTNQYYPAISPDKSFPAMVYNQSTCPTTTTSGYGKDCNADSDPSARMLMTALPPAATNPVDLTQANGPGVADNGATNLTNSFPKWAPFTFQLSEQQTLLWLTVSSTRKYGLRSPIAGGSENSFGTFIWMVGIDPSGLSAGRDPSFAPFCLPFQDITTSNHIAQWTTEVVGIVP